MVETIPNELASLLDEFRKELASLSGRIEKLEHPAPAAAIAAPPPAAAAAPPPQPQPLPGITEEELLAISGALAAYLGVRVHIRQVRLISSRAWAQQGRVFIQASHRLHS